MLAVLPYIELYITLQKLLSDDSSVEQSLSSHGIGRPAGRWSRTAGSTLARVATVRSSSRSLSEYSFSKNVTLCY